MKVTYRLQTENGGLVTDLDGLIFPNGSPKVVTWGTRTFVFHELRVEVDIPVFVYREAFAYAPLVGLPL